ncbi:uncharacterized protein TNCV_1874051 [Trichonephila clavipes]|nr:uncharacterized protein TNCV_1874051 [Trichonephila clavipes]
MNSTTLISTHSLRVCCCCCHVLPGGKDESYQSMRQVGLLHDRCRHHLSPAPQFWLENGGEGNILQPPAPVVSAATTHKTFGPTDFTRTDSVCTRNL